MNEGKGNILVVGVGGQGTILASKILAEVLLQAGYDVKMAEVHGMAQRGGSVVTQVRFDQRVFSPLIPKGEADYLLAFEKLESLRWLANLRPGGVVIVNDLELPPVSVLTGQAVYPQDIPVKLKDRAGTVKVVPAQKLARECGSIKSQNMVLLGVLAPFLGIGQGEWERAIAQIVPASTVEVNLAAFRAGWEQ
ncbi:MAG TPA: indolepyruvate oxidoreductase subunit beta [Firmicutes bacterium]|jgi:indolepyruvate ferredoxin oxidoreductase beta subunit|nr:indolepyruvate oxidoreductase subunit beta [Bacillota bacterium]